MGFRKFIQPSIAMALCLTVSPLCHAGFFDKPKPRERNAYLSGSYGSFTAKSGDFEDNNHFYGLGAGSKLSSYFGVEVTYTDLGHIEGTLIQADVSGFNFNLVGYMPLARYAELYLTGGVFFAKVDLSIGNYYDSSSEDEQPYYGVGLNFKVNEPLTLFAQYGHYLIEVPDKAPIDTAGGEQEFKFNTFNVGAKYLF